MLLWCSGGRVVKVESASRPDGARAVPAFYRMLHPVDQEVMTLDFTTADGRRALHALLDEADVVIESSRPRALEQLGCGPGDVDGAPGKVWISITGYGRGEPQRDWVAFGDDAAVAGGLVVWEDDQHPMFCGDALADPVTGMVAAAAAFESIAGGGGVVLDVAMARCAAWLAPPRTAVATVSARRNGSTWHVVVDGEVVAVRDRADEAQPARCTTRPATTVAATGFG
jgi:crotonobetainyl-CoA:carnitine CoA-transferase CaiB-like acyl-CoA transferase